MPPSLTEKLYPWTAPRRRPPRDRGNAGEQLTSVHSDVPFTIMKTVPISELRQRVADVIDEVQASDEPTVVLQRSRRAAYIVNPDRYERDQQELTLLRRQ